MVADRGTLFEHYCVVLKTCYSSNKKTSFVQEQLQAARQKNCQNNKREPPSDRADDKTGSISLLPAVLQYQIKSAPCHVVQEKPVETRGRVIRRAHNWLSVGV